MLYLVDSDSSQAHIDAKDAALTSELMRRQTETYKWEVAAQTDDETSLGAWQRFANGWGEVPVSDTRAKGAIGEVAVLPTVEVQPLPQNVINLAERRSLR